MFATRVNRIASNTVIEFDVSEETYQTDWNVQLWLKEMERSKYGFSTIVQFGNAAIRQDANNRELRIACCNLAQEILELWGYVGLAASMQYYRRSCRLYSGAVTTVRRPWGQDTLGHVKRVWGDRFVTQVSKPLRAGLGHVQAIGEYDVGDEIQYAVFLTGCKDPGWYNPEAGEDRIAPQLVTRMQWMNTPHIVLPENTVLHLRELMK